MANAWSSQHIVDAKASYNNHRYQQQKTTGLALSLTRYSSNKLKLTGYNQEYTMVAFPTGNRTRVRTIYATVSGSPGIIYYVYLSASSFFISTSAPTHTFAKLQVHKSLNAVLVGWMSFSAANVMDGEWNVYCYNHEPQRVYRQGVSCGNVTMTKRGFLTPPGKVTSFTRTGESSNSISCHNCLISAKVSLGFDWDDHRCTWWDSCCSTHQECTGTGTSRYCWNVCDGCSRSCYIFVSLSVYLSPGPTISTGVRDTFTLVQTPSGGSWWVYCNGEIIVTRPGA
jgi:hypothetical protein